MARRENVVNSIADHEVDCECAYCERARSCGALIGSFANARDFDLPKDLDVCVSELIINLGHFCEARELDFIKLIQHGVGRWRAELEASDEIEFEFTAKLTIVPKSATLKGEPLFQLLRKLGSAARPKRLFIRH